MIDENLRSLTSARIELLRALLGIADGSGNLQAVTAARDALEPLAAKIPRIEIVRQFEAYLALVRAVERLTQWEAAVRDAEENSTRFGHAVKYLTEDAKNLIAGLGVEQLYAPLLEYLARVTRPGGAASAARRLSLVPLPIPKSHSWLDADDKSSDSDEEAPAPSSEVHGPSLVAATFLLKGQVLDRIGLHVPPGVAHDLTVRLIVGRWPDEAQRLVLMPLSVVPDEVLKCPSFIFERPDDKRKELIGVGHIWIKTPQAFSSRPYDVGYDARFEGAGSSPSSAIDLRGGAFTVFSHDFINTPLTGFATADRAILDVRDRLRRTLVPPPTDGEIFDFLKVMSALSSIAGAALQGHDFASQINEAEFQRYILSHLRQRPELGAEVTEGAKSARGVMDPSYRGIPIELKVEKTKVISVDDADKYFDQARQYSAGNARKTGIIVVLECASKSTPPPGLDNDIDFKLVTPSDGKKPFGLGIVLMRGNLPAPSSHSP